MKSISKILVLGLFCMVMSACVTTRDQLNAERGIHADGEEVSTPSSGSVKSEDITPKVKTTEVVETETTTTSNPPATAPAPGTAGESAKTLPVPGPVSGAGEVVPARTPKPDVSTYSSDELRAEVARLTGEVEELQHDKQVNTQSQTEESKKAQERIAELEKKLKELQPDAVALPEGKTPFQAGKDAFIGDKCDEAITFLSQALAKSDVGKEAEEATYMRGECYFKKVQYNKAIVDFSHFPEKYQKSALHPKALLRIAESFEAMGRKDDAKAFYSDLADKFPKTAEGKLAKKRLKAKK